MEYNLICTSYTETKQGLVLRNNFTEAVPNEDILREVLYKWNIKIPYPYNQEALISRIYTGNMQIDNVAIHIRILKLK